MLARQAEQYLFEAAASELLEEEAFLEHLLAGPAPKNADGKVKAQDAFHQI